jgi:hypothetical protein
MSKDYIPHNDAEFDNFFKFLNQYVNEKCATSPPSAWNHIPHEARAALTEAYDTWHIAHDKTIGPHTPVETRAKNEARKAVERKLRPFVNQYLRFPPVTNEDRDAMSIHNRDEIKTPIPAPLTRPEYTIKVKDIRRLTVNFWDQGSESKAKPHGSDGAVICWAVRDTPPASAKELTNWQLATRSPFTLEFDEAERGKTVYLALCWQNDKGQRGSWSEIRNAVIP